MNTKKAVSPPKARWLREHPQAAVPAFVADHPELTDVSWHNDVCPSFNRRGWNGQLDIRLWVDFEKDEDREYKGQPRYLVTRYNWDNSTDEAEELHRGDDAILAVHALLAATKK